MRPVARAGAGWTGKALSASIIVSVQIQVDVMASDLASLHLCQEVEHGMSMRPISQVIESEPTPGVHSFLPSREALQIVPSI